MENTKKSILFEEHLRKIKHRVDYKINESPKYRPLVGMHEEFDEIPELTNEAGEQEDAKKPEGNILPAPSNDEPIGEPSNTPVPEFDKDSKVPAPENIETSDDMINGSQAEDSMNTPVEPQQEVNDIQNDIIKHNIEAMKSIHSQLENLNNVVQGLNNKLEVLNADVEEVREPTNTEKLMSKKDVSYPYYFNLNDFWNGNWFNENREKENEKGIKEMPDGTFVADFDELPQKSKIDIQNSFNDII